MRRLPSSLVAAFVALMLLADGLAASASAPPSGVGLRSKDAGDMDQARILGIMLYTPLAVEFDEAPARDAFKAIGQAMGVTILGRWSDDKVGHGIDPDAPLSMSSQRKLAIDVIEELLEQCEEFEDCTWQLRGGGIEIGTKRRLAVPAARERRTYDLTDLLLEPPYFARESPAGGYARVDSPYVDAVIGHGKREAIRSGAPPPRSTKGDIILELVEAISETIEPGHWDFGGDSKDQSGDAEADETAEAVSPFAIPPAKDPKAKPAKPKRNPQHWASVRVFREALIITAPDFIHRQIGGSPRPIRPVDIETVHAVTYSPPAADSDGDRATPADAAEAP